MKSDTRIDYGKVCILRMRVVFDSALVIVPLNLFVHFYLRTQIAKLLLRLLCVALSDMDMAARHRARASSIRIMKVEVIPASKCRRPNITQFHVSISLKCFVVAEGIFSLA